MKKRFLEIFLALCLVMGVLPGTVRAVWIVQSGECGAEGDSLTYTLDSEGTLTISGTGAIMNDFGPRLEASMNPNGEWTAIRTVEIKDGVTSIGSCAFAQCYGLSSVIIPNSVTIIGYDAFKSCISLSSVTIPDSVTIIGDGALNGCTSLSSVTIPDSVTIIGDGAFEDCTSLTSVTIPGNVTSIDGAFQGCTSLASVTIPDSIISIDGAFQGCTSLTNITIPDSVTNIDGAFVGCTSLTSVTISDSVTSIDGTFQGCTSLSSVTIPNSVTIIDSRAFQGCTSLTSIIIPYGVTTIGNDAFEGCTGLTSVTIPNSVTNISDYGAFWNCTSLTNVTIPECVTRILNTFQGCTNLTSITIQKDVTNIKDGLFYDCTNLTSVTIPDSVAIIGISAFEGCTNLTSVTIPDSITTIGDSAFKDCTSLISVIIPDGVTNIGNDTFENCSGLASIAIPSSVTTIGYYAFWACTNLADVYYNGNKSQWDEITIQKYNDCLTSATIHCSGTGPDTPDTPGDDKDAYVDSLIGHSIVSADTDTKQTLRNAILNLLFYAQYRPTESRIPGDTMTYTGSLEVNKTWPIQNIHPYGNHVTDNALGTIWFAESGAGCMSYALFATAYTYGTSGNRVECIDRSVSGVKTFIQTYADPGEQLRYNGRKEGMHSIVFLGEDSGGDGFYYISYNGGARSGGGSHALFVGYHTYTDFANNISTSLTVRDANGGSYLMGTGKSMAEVRTDNGVNKTVVRIACPVEATLQFNNEILDSRNPGSASFGTVERSNDQIVFKLDYNYDYDLNINGTDAGDMTLTLEYYKDDVIVDSRTFVDVPIASNIEIQASKFDPMAPFVLYTDLNSAKETTWGAGKNETVFAPDEDFSSLNNDIGIEDGTSPTGQLGDLNGDGKVTMADVIRLARGAAKYVTLTELEQRAGDVNGDGKITMTDVIRVARFAAGYSPTL